MHEVLDEQQDVVCPFAERRHFDWEDIEAVEQVLPETAVGHGCRQITVGRRDHSDVDADRLRATDPFELPLL